MPAPHHVGYWVDDLEAAVARMIDGLGIGPFLRHEHIGFASFRWADGTEVDHEADPPFFNHSAAFAAWGPVVVELAEVHEIDPALAAAYDLPDRADLGRTGLRVGHVSWVVDHLGAESERLQGLGCELIHTASSGAVEVAWHRGGPLFPHPIEVHRAGAPILGMHGRLSALAAGWDGVDPLRPIAAP